MRQITKESIEAFESLTPFNKSNMKVKILGTENGVSVWAELYLFDNKIAEIHKNKRKKVLKITNAGWKSNTTKERLNALEGVHIHQKQGVWYLNGDKWNGELTQIK
tara:strand:- start:710 stop:1027 length:318 start_codon:yes stop_codon:yes gene_type:complete